MERDIYFYMANLGSEVLRMVKARDENNDVMLKNCNDRIDKIIEKIKSFNNQSANKEISILKKYLPKIKRQEVSQLFNPFALKVMSKI